MAGLRDLLGKFESVTATEVAGGSVKISSAKGCVWSMMAYCGGGYDDPGCCDQHNRSAICYWCVPTGTTTMTLSLWGGGGAGASQSGCWQGSPGGAGAFAFKTIEPTVGNCYEIHAGYGGSAVPDNNIGTRGCASYAIGTGLDNFCADGGFGGLVLECCYYGKCCISGPDGEGYFYMGREECCALYYGADGGAPGLPGFWVNYCGCGSDQNNCYVKQAVPYPGGILTIGGGHNLIRLQGNACNQEWSECQLVGFGGQRYRPDPGRGGISATTCAGGSCCGAHGGPGMVRIEYR